MTHQELLETFEYNDGKLYWKKLKPNARSIKIGDRAGSTTIYGYRVIVIGGKIYREHRLVWMYHHGSMPSQQLDHINRQRDDNRIENLRECSNAENCQNRTITVQNSSGYIGVSKQKNKWRAEIRSGGKYHYLGLFTSAEEARDAYVNAKKNLHLFNPIL